MCSSDLTLFLDDEWIIIPSNNHPEELWEKLVSYFRGNKKYAYRASKYCTQIPLANAYINKVCTFKSHDEHLLNGETHHVTIDSLSKLVYVKKSFTKGLVLEGNLYVLDYCDLNIVFDPIRNMEIEVKWEHVIEINGHEINTY